MKAAGHGRQHRGMAGMLEAGGHWCFFEGGEGGSSVLFPPRCAALEAAGIQEAGVRRVPSQGCSAAKPLLVFSSCWSQ